MLGGGKHSRTHRLKLKYSVKNYIREVVIRMGIIKRSKRILAYTLIVIISILVVVIAYNINDSDIKAGRLSDTTPQVNSGEFATYCNTNIQVVNGRANVLVQNSEINTDDCVIRLVLDDGRLLYESDTLRPGFYIEQAKLFEHIEKGEYDGTLAFDILDDNSEVKSTMKFDVKITQN